MSPLSAELDSEGEASAEQEGGAAVPTWAEGPEPRGDDAGDQLLPAGSPLRWRALAPIGLGATVMVALMASDLSPRRAVPLCLLLAAVLTAGVLDLMGSFDDAHEVTTASSARTLLAPMAVLLGALLAMLVLVRAAVAGRLPTIGSAVAMPLVFLTAVAAFFGLLVRLGPWRLDERGEPRPIWRRHGFWLVVATTLLYLPMLGNHGLIDPWETHYGEVAREILARDDWISLWWAQDGWFWSKPVFAIWLQAGAMALGGVRYEPGQMLSAAAGGLHPQPEWALRLPVFLLAVLGIYLLYKGVARSHGRRAGLLAATVLVTAPQFFLAGQQTMTDMPFVAAIAAAVGLWLCAGETDPNQRVAVYCLRFGRGVLRLSLFQVVIGALLLLVVPQIAYLLSRNVSLALSPHFDLRLVADSFMAGSPGNCGLPGNQSCQPGLRAVVHTLSPAVQALIWLQALALLLWLSWGERRRQRLLYLAAWLCACVATMTKGPAGLALPAAAVLAYLVATGRWRELARMEIVPGLLMFAAMVLPWFVAMYVRHGQPFTDRLLFHDMFQRAFEHVHDTNTGDDLSFRYYLWQLGYAVFPFSGLAPIALVRWFGDEQRGARHRTSLLMAAWFIIGFALFTLMGTKYHHYCLPIVPPLAVLTGLLLDEMLSSSSPAGAERAGAKASRSALMLGAAAVGAAWFTFMVGRDLAWGPPGRLSQIRLLHLFTYNYGRPWPKSVDFGPWLWGFAIAATVTTASAMVVRFRRQAVLALLLVAGLWTAWGIDVYLVRISPHWGQRELLIRYERERVAQPGPLVAYQMNWKGENFYRGNQIAAFVASGRKFQSWVDEQKKKGTKIFYFVTEHKRTGNLKRELGSPAVFDELSDTALNNKFVLLRAAF